MIIRISTFLLLALFSSAVSNDPSKEASLPLNMDIDWVIQGASISFTGFFCEFLGFSSAFRTLLPQLRVWKGRYKHSMLEPMILGDRRATMDTDTELNGWIKVDRMMDRELFDKEARNVKWLAEPSQPSVDEMVNTFKQSLVRSRFAPSFSLNTSNSDKDGRMMLPKECMSFSIIETDTRYIGGRCAE